MLKTSRLPMALALIMACVPLLIPESFAEAPCSTDVVFAGGYNSPTVQNICNSQSGSTQSSGGSSDSSGGSVEGCFNRLGEPVDCWLDEMWWSSTYNAYCKQVAPPDNAHVTGGGEPVGSYFRCAQLVVVGGVEKNFMIWVNEPAPPTPTSQRIEGEVRTVVASLGLHPPTVGVGAYVYPDARDWGLSWWVGAPMWLWVDARDNLQWGEHTLETSLDGTTISTKIRAAKVTYDVGDGSRPIVCGSVGSTRYNLDDRQLLRDHSPSGCEHVYMHTNVLGDKNSRYTVSAVVTWEVKWSATTGQSGSFTIDVASVDNPAIHIGEIRIVDCNFADC